MLGAFFLDPIASFIIALFILRLGYKIVLSGISQVVDQAADPITVDEIKKIVSKFEEIKNLDEIKTRMFGMKIYADLEISLDFSMSLEDAHNIAEKLHDEIEVTIPEIIHCMIHVNPFYPKK